jgi:hypothetical protein
MQCFFCVADFPFHMGSLSGRGGVARFEVSFWCQWRKRKEKTKRKGEEKKVKMPRQQSGEPFGKRRPEELLEGDGAFLRGRTNAIHRSIPIAKWRPFDSFEDSFDFAWVFWNALPLVCLLGEGSARIQDSLPRLKTFVVVGCFGPLFFFQNNIPPNFRG